MKLQHTLVAFAALAVLGCCDKSQSPQQFHAPTSPALMAGGCGNAQGQGPKTTVGASVQVDPKHCQEKPDQAVGPQAEFAVLDCITSAEAHIEIVFPREEWHSLKRRGIGVVDAGPGK
jgi:hypothetical protein